MAEPFSIACHRVIDGVEKDARIRARIRLSRVDIELKQHFPAGNAAELGILPVGLVQKPGQRRRGRIGVRLPAFFLVARRRGAVANQRNAEIRPRLRVVQRNLEAKRKSRHRGRRFGGALQ